MYRLYGTCTRSNCGAVWIVLGGAVAASIIELGGHSPRRPPDAAQARRLRRNRCRSFKRAESRAQTALLPGQVGAPTLPPASIWPAAVTSQAAPTCGKPLGTEDFPAPSRAIHPSRLNKRRDNNRAQDARAQPLLRLGACARRHARPPLGTHCPICLERD